jgi:hypothetical protein
LNIFETSGILCFIFFFPFLNNKPNKIYTSSHKQKNPLMWGLML